MAKFPQQTLKMKDRALDESPGVQPLRVGVVFRKYARLSPNYNIVNVTYRVEATATISYLMSMKVLKLLLKIICPYKPLVFFMNSSNYN